MKKKSYSKPILVSEYFFPNSYVTTCVYASSYKGKCDISGYVFIDSNNNGKYDPGIDNYKYYNTACQDFFESDTKPVKNAFLFQKKDIIQWKDIFGNIHKDNSTGLRTPYIAQGTPIEIYNFKNQHANYELDTKLHHNVS